MTTAKASSNLINIRIFSAPLLAALFGRRPRRRGLLDPNELSDHLKRDLGFLDGSETPHRRG